MKRLVLLTITTGLLAFCAPIVSLGQDDPNKAPAALNLDKIPELPASQFPDIPEEAKNLIHQQGSAILTVKLYNFIAKEKDKDQALNALKDGDSYLLSAKKLAPSLTPKQAFVIYLCWNQASLWGNKVTLEKLDDSQALVRMEATYFLLYEKSSYLKDQISADDYKNIFETIWKDRAEKAGWNLNITYEKNLCTFDFHSPAAAQQKETKPITRFKIKNTPVETFIKNLKSTDLDDRRNAAYALGRKRDPVAVEPLMEALKNDEDSQVRKNAAFALGKLERPAAVPALIHALQDSAPKVRGNAAYALNRIRDERAIKPLIDQLSKETDEDTIAALSDALMSITTETLGQEPQAWQNWWQENKDKYQNQ